MDFIANENIDVKFMYDIRINKHKQMPSFVLCSNFRAV